MMPNAHKRAWVAVLSSGILASTACFSTVDPAAEQAFIAKLGQTTVTVFPACLRMADPDTYDADAATDIAAFLADEDFAETVVSADQVPITGPWHSNQLQMWQESAAALGEYVQTNPITTEYAFLAEYLFLGGNGGVGGVHCYFVDSQGTLAYGFLINSHNPDFAEADPQTVQDCTALLIKALRDDLQELK